MVLPCRLARVPPHPPSAKFLKALTIIHNSNPNYKNVFGIDHAGLCAGLPSQKASGLLLQVQLIVAPKNKNIATGIISYY